MMISRGIAVTGKVDRHLESLRFTSSVVTGLIATTDSDAGSFTSSVQADVRDETIENLRSA
jgi:hypothetical protein